jgi:hypothetical protein
MPGEGCGALVEEVLLRSSSVPLHLIPCRAMHDLPAELPRCVSPGTSLPGRSTVPATATAPPGSNSTKPCRWHAVDAALNAYRNLGRQIVADVQAAELVERTARGLGRSRLGAESGVPCSGFPSRKGIWSTRRALMIIWHAIRHWVQFNLWCDL